MTLASLLPPREHTGNPVLDRIQAALFRVAFFLTGIPFLDGVLLDGGKGDGTGPGLVIGTSATTINHGLGRAPRGFIVLDTQVNPVTPVRASTQPADLTKQLNLIATSAVTVRLWVW